MKKILFIMHYPPPIHGAAMVGKCIRDSELINTHFECEYINLSTSKKVDDIGKVGLDKWISYFGILYNTIKSILLNSPNLVYITMTAKGIGFYKDALIALIAKLMGNKVVYHFHNKGVSDRQDKWLDNLLYKFVFKNADVILLSKNLYKDIIKYVPKEKVHFCSNGIPENRKHNLIPKIKKDDKNITILFLSNLLVGKGIYTLLDAFKLLENIKLPYYHCTLVGGEGDIDADTLRDRIKFLKIEHKVKYIGKKYGDEKENEYLKADIFVFPSHNETFGLVNLEAMQFHLPVISTYEGGIPDVVLDKVTGFLVNKKDSKALADKIEVLISDPDLRKRMGDNGRKRYEENFTLEVFETNFLTIIDKI